MGLVVYGLFVFNKELTFVDVVSLVLIDYRTNASTRQGKEQKFPFNR